MRDDLELLRDHAAGSEEAFRLLVERHAGMVRGTALRIVRDADLADEVTQAVFILLARKAPNLPARTIVAGWLHHATRFVARSAIRSEFRRQQRHRQLAAMNDLERPNNDFDPIEPHLDESLGELGARDRDAIVLRFLEGRSFAEVGTALGTTEAAAKMRVGRALERLRSALARHGVVVTPATLGSALTLQTTPSSAAALATQVAGITQAATSPAASQLALVHQAIHLMTLQKLKTALIAAVLALALLGGGVSTLSLWPRGKLALAEDRLVVNTFEPMAGEWEGTFETKADDQPNPRRQPATVSIQTSNQGRSCSIELQVLDRNDRPQATFRISHELNERGDRILTTDNPEVSTNRLDGPVTETLHVTQPLEWRAGFRASLPNSPDVVECRWSRQDNELFISRVGWTVAGNRTNRVTSELALRPRSNQARTAVRALPRGLQNFDGVSFTIVRPINLIGAKAARAKGSAFAQVTDPSVQGRGRHIHVLHTGDHGASATGDDIWRLVLHYADGATEYFDFAYDIHLRNFWRRDGDGPRAPTDPDTSIAWVGTSQESDQKGADLVVSRTTLANPHPETEIIRADYVSLLGPSSAYVLAVAVSNDGPKPATRSRRTSRDVRVFTLMVRNGAGQPQANLPLELDYLGDDFKARLAPGQTDDHGRATLFVPADLVRAIRYRVRLSKGRTEVGEIALMAEEKDWLEQEIRLPE